MMLKDYSKILYESNFDNKQFSVIRASIVNSSLRIYDCHSRVGGVEAVDFLDEENTKKFCEFFHTSSSSGLVRILKQEFGEDGSYYFLANFREFCNDHGIKYNNIVIPDEHSKIIR